MSKILFLGIDGVLNDVISYRQDDTSFPWEVDESRLCHIKKIVEDTGAEIILIDSWRKHWSIDENKCDDIGKYLNESFEKFGLAIRDKTYFSATDDRCVEISYYLAEYSDVTAFSILDKAPSDLKRATRFVGVDQQNVCLFFALTALRNSYLIVYGQGTKFGIVRHGCLSPTRKQPK